MTEHAKRILIVDDNQEIHSDFAKVLGSGRKVGSELSELEAFFDDATPKPAKESTVQFDSAYQGDEAVAMVKESIESGNPYCVAFIDVRMPPGLDGIETTRQIWEIDPEIQIVICSAYSDYSWDEIVEKLKYSDRFLILKKPFESIEVRQLAAALHQRWVDARSDVLTGLINRRAFLSCLELQFGMAKAELSDMSCVMIDLDFFKRVNDLHGHGAGDEVLQNASKLLARMCREGDHTCRYGGEEFCVMLRNVDEAAAVKWAERVRNLLKNTAMTSGEHALLVTASFGVACISSKTDFATDLIANADKALQMAKRAGRDRVAQFSERCKDDGSSNSGLSQRNLFQKVDASQLMQPPNSIRRTATLKDAAVVLLEHNLTSAPVVDEDGTMVGVLAESDLLQIFSGQQPESLSVDDVMRASVVGFSEETDLQEIFDFLVRVAIPQVVIVRNGKPCGVIGRKVLLEWLCSAGFGSRSESTTTTRPVLGTLPLAISATSVPAMPSTGSN